MGGSTSELDSCEYDFTSALANVGSFLATARVLEFVGVDAYVLSLSPLPLCLSSVFLVTLPCTSCTPYSLDSWGLMGGIGDGMGLRLTW